MKHVRAIHTDGGSEGIGETVGRGGFVGHPEAGERSVVIYTLLGSCRRHSLNPFGY
jgi:hypothetical protein